ncbi:MAG: 2-amino-4-hydroxy-6-hydroxymethyldihydropteridine diphosphokinase [Desulfobacterales bacterium]|nr:2-amino-4-hydroxy-6-hydroxymethyldihydropteridine diphosphokinase [Desulfobacterales bacterium]
MSPSFTAYLSIGSNRGDKKANLDTAIGELNAHVAIQVTGVSRYYRTQPQNFADQDWFVNAALKIETSIGDPVALLAEMKTIEHRLDPDGKAFRFGPRVVDLDLIYFEDHVLETETLELPHPRMHERCFVLQPMCDIGAEAIHPVLKKNSLELLDNVEHEPGQEVVLLEEEV